MHNPKLRRNLSRLVPFAIIWLVTGWVFLFTEMAATNFKNASPDSAITLTVPVFLFASLAVVGVGLLVGAIELVFFDKAFKQVGLGRKITYKFLIYTVFILIMMLITYPIASSIETNASMFSEQVWQKFICFLTSLTLISTLVQLSFSLLLSLLYSAISENIGHNVLINFFTASIIRLRWRTAYFCFWI